MEFPWAGGGAPPVSPGREDNILPEYARYDRVAAALHWLMTVLIFCLLGLGFYMEDLPKGSDQRSFAFALHKSLGLTAALLLALRFAWRLRRPPPPWPPAMPLWQVRLALAVHRLFYVFLFLQPLSGYLSSSFSGYDTRWWGIPLPQWGWKSPPLNELFTGFHEIFALVLLCLIALHLFGALLHFWRPGSADTLQRMPPFRRRHSAPASPPDL